jgi:hypothetical protein
MMVRASIPGFGILRIILFSKLHILVRMNIEFQQIPAQLPSVTMVLKYPGMENR